ncbi:MAG: MTH865 family protein [Halopenitus sp.]
MTDVESGLRAQFIEAFEGAEFPVENQMDLVPALPDGPSTTFEAENHSFTAMELAAKLGDHQEFPYDSPEQLADDIITGLKQEDLI